MNEIAYEDIPDLLRAIADLLENPPPDNGGGSPNVVPITGSILRSAPSCMTELKAVA